MHYRRDAVPSSVLMAPSLPNLIAKDVHKLEKFVPRRSTLATSHDHLQSVPEIGPLLSLQSTATVVGAANLTAAGPEAGVFNLQAL